MKKSDEFPEIWEIKYTDVAEFDLDGIHDYIAETLVEPIIAANQANRIMDKIDTLDHQPLRYRLYDDEPWRSEGLRLMNVDNFTVFYVPFEERGVVWVIRIMYSRRDFKRHLGEPDDYD